MAVLFIRTVLLYALIIVTLRLMGKRQLGQLEPSELVVTILISELAAVPMQDPEVPLVYGLIPMVVLLALEIMTAALAMKSLTIRRLLCGRPTALICEGTLCQANLSKCRLNLDELTEELRLQGILNLSDVQYAILETNGQLSVIPWPGDEPATKSDCGVTERKRTMPIPIISDGRLLQNNLTHSGRSKRWLDSTLRKHGVSQVRNVFWLSVEQDGTVQLILREREKA